MRKQSIIKISALVLVGGLAAVTIAQETEPTKTTTEIDEKQTKVKDDNKKIDPATNDIKNVEQETPLDVDTKTPGDTKQESKKQTQQAKNNTDERFIPTEEISEDLAVSFPIDI